MRSKTTIIAARNADTAFIASDSQATFDSGLKLSCPKIHQITPKVLIGGSGEGKPLQVIFEMLEIDGVPDYGVERWLITKVIPQIRELLLNSNSISVVDGIERMDSDLLLVIDGEFFIIEGDLSVTKIEGEYAAIGSGSAYALGYLYFAGSRSVQPFTEDDVKGAIEAACEFDSSCSPPIQILSMPLPERLRPPNINVMVENLIKDTVKPSPKGKHKGRPRKSVEEME